jgi:hypothetical protein
MVRDTGLPIDNEGLDSEHLPPKGQDAKVKAHDEVFGAIRDGGPDYRNVSLATSRPVVRDSVGP